MEPGKLGEGVVICLLIYSKKEVLLHDPKNLKITPSGAQTIFQACH